MRCWSFGLRSKERRHAADSPHIVPGQLLECVAHFSYDELRAATDDFSTRNKIGRGGFGIVYKGKLRNGLRVAIKKLALASKQGQREFLAEINAIALATHPNLVRLIGCCVEGTNPILVYEYLENNSLAHALLGQKETRIRLDWQKRSAICVGIAKGLTFLHEEAVPRVVHRDIKASNILLDKSFTPKIGDFGLAKLFPDDITHISTRIAGTTGYLAPEYAMAGQLTMKADVYSFGILILELVSGKSSSKADWGGSDKFLLEWAWELYERGSLLELVDPELEEYREEEALRYMKVALFCTQGAARRRPSMSQVVDMLSRDIKLNEKQLTAPGYFQDSDRLSVGSTSGKKQLSSDSGYRTSSEPITITHVRPR